MSAWAIGPAREDEAGQVAELINAINSIGPSTKPVAMTAEIVRRDLLGERPRARLLVAREGAGDPARQGAGEPVREGARLLGFATAGTIYDAERAAEAFMLLDLYVRPEARRRGIARALMAALAAEAAAREAGCIWWGVDDGDDEAMEFYRAIGAASEGGFTGMILAGPSLAALARAA